MCHWPATENYLPMSRQHNGPILVLPLGIFPPLTAGDFVFVGDICSEIRLGYTPLLSDCEIVMMTNACLMVTNACFFHVAVASPEFSIEASPEFRHWDEAVGTFINDPAIRRIGCMLSFTPEDVTYGYGAVVKILGPSAPACPG